MASGEGRDKEGVRRRSYTAKQRHKESQGDTASVPCDASAGHRLPILKIKFSLQGKFAALSLRHRSFVK